MHSIFVVIPTLLLTGPLALLALLFPAWCAGLVFFWRRWSVLLAVVGVGSVLIVAHALFRGHAQGSWWGTPGGLLACLAVVSGIGAALSCWRTWRAAPLAEPDGARKARWIELATLALASASGLAAVLFGLWQGTLFRTPLRECLPLIASVWIGTAFLLGDGWARRRWPQRTPMRGMEAVMLTALAAGQAGLALASGNPASPEVVWTFEAIERGAVYSSPLVHGPHVYASAALVNASFEPIGAVYCLDRDTGKALWTFNAGGRMKQALSTPVLDGGHLYVGEGLHEDAACRLYCLDALSGAEVWNFPTGSHVESSPRLVEGSVFFAAGEDGIYCLAAAKGKPRWRFAGLHIDTTPAVADGRVFAGSVYGKPETVCLAADTGKPLWRKPSDLSVLVPPATAPGRVYFGLGNGKLNRIDPNPAGALVCLDAISGDILWRRDLPDAVIGAPVVHDDLICFGCRDHHCYCLDRADGGLRWKTDLGSPVAAAPTIAGPHVYAVGARGQLCCLDIQTGAVTWRFNIARHSGAAPEILGAPSFAADQLYVGAGLDNSITSAAVVYCVKSPRP